MENKIFKDSHNPAYGYNTRSRMHIPTLVLTFRQKMRRVFSRYGKELLPLILIFIMIYAIIYLSEHIATHHLEKRIETLTQEIVAKDIEIDSLRKQINELTKDKE